jgi:hypothetical protein
LAGRSKRKRKAVSNQGICQQWDDYRRLRLHQQVYQPDCPTKSSTSQ